MASETGDPYLNHRVEQRVMVCLSCGRVASVPAGLDRPICLHSWEVVSPEVWDGNNTDGEGRRIEEGGMPNPGPATWNNMVELKDIRDDLIAKVLGLTPPADSEGRI